MDSEMKPNKFFYLQVISAIVGFLLIVATFALQFHSKHWAVVTAVIAMVLIAVSVVLLNFAYDYRGEKVGLCIDQGYERPCSWFKSIKK